MKPVIPLFIFNKTILTTLKKKSELFGDISKTNMRNLGNYTRRRNLNLLLIYLYNEDYGKLKY